MTRRARMARAALVVCALAATAAAQTTVSLEQINARRPGDFSPVLEGRTVSIEGVVVAPPFVISNYSHLAVQDDSGHGATIEGSGRAFSALHAGDRIAARGVVSKRGGLPVILSSQIEVLRRETPPGPRVYAPRDLQRFERAGLLVTTEARVVERGENTAGEYLLIGDLDNPLKVFLPVQHSASGGPRFERIEAGDKVRVTGVASQYCPLPPFDRYFQVVVADDAAVALVQKRWLIAPETFVFCLGALALALAFWWMRERRMSAQRKMVRTFYSLGEQMTGAATSSDVVHRLRAVLVPELKLGGVNLYLYNRSSKMLDRVQPDSAAPPFSVPVYGPEGSLPIGPAVCFRNQTLLAIADTRRSPFFPDGRQEGRPRSVIFVPMFAEAELVGVLEFFDSQAITDFSADEKVLAQHLANQIAIALRLMEEKSIREQLFRSEKLAAMGRLISGVAEELRAPIESITRMSDNLAAELPGATWSDVRSIAAESRRASEIVARLVSFMQPTRAEARRFDINSSLRSVVDFRREQWHERGVAVRDLLCPYPVFIHGSQGQLERVFLDLLIQAEQSLAEAQDKTITVASSVLARRILIEIGYGLNPQQRTAAGASADGHLNVPGESVTRGIVHSHGGEIRMVHTAVGECRIEVELPVVAAGAEAPEERVSKRQFTCLIVDPVSEEVADLTRLLTNQGCRVIPAATAEEAVERVQRLRFDVIFCAIRLPGMNWVQLSELVRPHVEAFVLLSDGFDWELSRGLVSGDSYILPKPVEQSELERILAIVDAKVAENRGMKLIRPQAMKRAAN